MTIKPTIQTQEKPATIYPEVVANAHFPDIEADILTYWQENKVFEQSVENRAPEQNGASNAYVFYDGPPFANGLPHYGHLLTGYVKDAIARYQTMRGHRVERRFGWDCHGLPAEMGAEKALNISGRAAIMDYGIEKFNAHCKSSVMQFSGEWRDYVNRQGRWVDFDNDYKTMDTPFMESVLWAFKQLHEKGLIYESMRVMPYSWAAETPVSNFETRIDNATRMREDKAAYVKFKLKEKPKSAPEADNYYLIAWTTTPWTLPSNLALAASSEMEYEAIIKDDDCYITQRVSKFSKELGKPTDDKNTFETTPDFTCKGAELIGLTYEPLFPYLNNTKNAFRVLDGTAFVTEGEGTGIVHMASGFGEIDQQCCAENGIETIVPVDEKGRFTSEIFDVMLETERLYLRAFTESDYPLYQSLQADPKVAATTSDGVLPEEKIRAEFDRLLADQDAKGFTQWAVFQKSDGAFIGRAGFDNRDYDQFNSTDMDCVELRYALLSNFWGKGYGREVATGLMDWASLHIKAPLVIAGCNPTYEPAVNLLKKLGFSQHEHVAFRDQTVWYHTQTMDHWRESRGDSLKKQPKALWLNGLNVVADTAINQADEASRISEKDVGKYGLANMRIVRWLKAHGQLVKDESYKHNYPHCWRTDTPLIYRAMSSWYVNVQAIKEKMVANNQQIDWIPDHVKNGQMGKGIESAPDWSISRNRFWGTPIPIWKSKSGKIHVCGSIEEIETLSGKKVTDLHRPFIDEVLLKIDGEEYTRIEDVFDCWFESGSMPFAQLHYPFENKEKFEANFPADFITEYIAQTRGWFYTLQVLSAALFEKAPFKHCICHGVVIDEETGLKYSKRLKNYKDPREVMDAYGSDALRFMMLASPVMRGADLAVDPEGKFIRDVVRLYIKPLWNAYHFFTLYANADGIQAKEITASDHVLDQYVLAKAKAAVLQIRESLDTYDTPGATEAFSQFFEVLNNWYIRRSRSRFWAEEKTVDKQAAYDTLYTALILMCKAAAPLMPFVTDAVYLGLTGNSEDSMSEAVLSQRSVHLADFPDVSAIEDDAGLLAKMDRVRDVCATALAIRSKENIRTRQPLKTLHYIGALAEGLKDFETIIKDELNVHALAIGSDVSAHAEFMLKVNFPVVGKRLPKKVKDIIAASKKGDYEKQDDGNLLIAGETLLAEEYSLLLQPKEAAGAAALSSQDGLVMLDLNLTPELITEGVARDLVRMVQQARKDADLHVSDRIALHISGGEAVGNALATFGDYIAEQTLAELQSEQIKPAQFNTQETLEGDAVHLQLSVMKAA